MPETFATRSGNYLDPHTLAAIAPLELRARLIVEGLMTGMHRSPYQGFSVEFAQHRQYAPGDDIRHLDWKVFGRTDKLYLKQYQKETNLDLMLLVDSSGSMAYGSAPGGRAEGRGPRAGGGESGRVAEWPSGRAGGGDSANISAPIAARAGVWRKFDHAASIAAALAYLALHQQDRVGVMLFADAVRSVTRPSNSRGHWRTIIDQLSSEPMDPAAALSTQGFADRRTDLGRMFDQVHAKLSQRSLVVVLSDLFDDPASIDRGLARLSHRRHDVIVMQVVDHAELEFPFRSPSEFIGLEAEGRLRLDPASLRKAYREAFTAHQKEIEQITRRYQFDHLMLDTSRPLGAPLSHFLATRSALISKGKH